MNSRPLFCPGVSLPGRFFLYVAAILVPLVAQGQTSGTITGVVKDAGRQAPLKGATVRLRDAADSTAKPLGDLSAENGAFSIEQVAIGRKYTLEVVFVGYERHVVENVVVTADKPRLNLGEMLLRQTSIDVGEVQVNAEREAVVVMADKTVYAVENNPAYTATTVSELLGQIPSVEVDQDGKVSLRGNDNVTIMMNDRPITMPAEQRNKFLQSLPANAVKDIEIRTNPGAQFDAKYDGGIINIVTRRTMSDMFGGTVSAGGDTRMGLSGNTGLYYNGDKLNASLGGGVNRNNGSGSNTSLRLNYRDSNEWRDQAAGSTESSSRSYYGYGQIDYKFTENDVASFSFNLHGWASDFSSNGLHTFYNVNDAVVGRYYDTSGPLHGVGNSGDYKTASLLLKHGFSKDHKISLDFSYNSNNYQGEYNYSSTFFLADGTPDSARNSGRYTGHDKSNSAIITTLAYENPINDDLTLSFGGKNEMNMLDNSTSVSNRDRTTGEFVLDTVQTNHYLPENTIYALYGNAAYKLFKDLSFQAGVRYERATVSAEYASGQSIISRDYSNIFPSGSIAYNITDEHSLTFSYRRSIALPDIEALNPVRFKWSDFMEQSGNPDLEPEFTQSLELNYNTFWGAGNMISVAPYYSTTDGSIEQSENLANGITRSTYVNFNGTYSIGSELSIAMRPVQWLNFRVSGDVHRKVNRGSAIPGDVHSAASGYSGNAMLSADLMEGLTFSMNMFFRAPATVGASQRGGYTYTSFSLRQRLLENKLNITLRANDPFNLQKWENEYDSPEFHSESSSKWLSRYVGLNISYTFGTTPRMERHNQEKTDTKGGGGSGGGGGSPE